MRFIRKILYAVVLLVGDILKPPNLWDALAVSGIISLGSGMWMIYPPAAIIVVGLILMALGAWGALTWTRENDKRSLRPRKGRN